MGFFNKLPFQGRSRIDIERITESFLQKVYPEALRKPLPMDVERFLTYDLLKHFDVSIEILGDEDMGCLIEGMYDPFANKILFSENGFNELTRGNLRSRFTGAHEGFHAMEHGKQIRTMQREELLYRVNMQRQQRTVSIPIYKQAEWQANHGAGSLLMPRKAVEMVLRDVRAGELFDEVSAVSAAFKVSEDAAETRIRKIRGDY